MPQARKPIRAFDLFCGAGGSSCGARMAGAKIVGGVDAWDTAIQTYQLNFPEAETWEDRIESLNPHVLARKVGRVDLLLASPECTNHTFAKGNRRNGREQERSRRTSFEVIRFATAMLPRWIVVENVISMRRWTKFLTWKKALQKLGYHTKEMVLDAQNFGVSQTRRRLFIVADRDNEPKFSLQESARLGNVKRILHPFAEVNGFNYTYKPLFGRRPKLAADTLARARRAIKELGTNKPFLIVYYGTDAAGGWQPLNRPLRTITTLDRFAIVRPSKDGHIMRMLQPPELAAAMGFPASYKWPDVTRRDRIKLVGNAVCPPVMRHVIAALLQ